MRLALLLACLALGALVSILSGQDANWDLLNYHLANGAAWLQGRFNQDLLPTGMQSYLNPLLDAAYAGLALGPLRHHPRALAATMGLWFGLALYLAARLAALLYEGDKAPALAALLLGVTGTAMIVQIGTTTGELQAAAIMLAGLFVLLRAASAARPTSWTIAASGVLFGIAGGLKLTALAYAPAACLAACSLYRPARVPMACAAFASGWLAGFAAIDGWWALQLVERFASPVFPLFNGVFRSPWYPPASMIDDRFFPRGVAQWLFYPLYWTGNQAAGPNELRFRDFRGAVALCLGLLTTLAWASARSTRPPLTRPQRAALVFLATGYATWLATSAILRYAVVIEVVAGLTIPLLLGRLLQGRARLLGLNAVFGLTLATTRYLPSPRIPYTALRADMNWVEPGMLIVVTFRGPSNHVIAFIPPRDGVRVINIGTTALEARGWRLHDEMAQSVRNHAGRIMVVTEGNIQGRFPELAELGLSPELANCRPISNTFIPVSATGIHACEAQRREPPRLASPFWRQAAQRYRTIVQPVAADQSLIGAAYLNAVGLAARGTRFIDWTSLLWTGTRNPGPPLPILLDPETLYVLAPEHVTAMAARLNPATDALGWVDGLIVAAPGWRQCSSCNESPEPLRIAAPAMPLAVGDIGLLDSQAGGNVYLAEGWWPQDAGPSWSREHAAMLIPLAADLPPLSTLVLTGITFTAPGLPTQRVVVELPGQPLSATLQSLAGEGMIHLPLRREWLHQQPDGTYLLNLRLSCPDAASPAQLGLSADHRRLGFSVSTVRLQRS